jgi:hypothetical protein
MPGKAIGKQPISLIFSNEIKDLEAILTVNTDKNPF